MGTVMTRLCADKPGKSDLVRRGAMTAGNGGKHLAGLQPALVNGKVPVRRISLAWQWARTPFSA